MRKMSSRRAAAASASPVLPGSGVGGKEGDGGGGMGRREASHRSWESSPGKGLAAAHHCCSHDAVAACSPARRPPSGV